jgi:hypothetical protein
MPHRIPATLRQLRALEALGVAVPPKPYLGFSDNLLEGRPCTPDERALDSEYQRQLDVWISQIEGLYDRHVPQKTT